MGRGSDRAARCLFFLCALTTAAALLLIAAYLILAGLPALREIGWKDFLLGKIWDSAHAEHPQFGILPLLLTSLYGTAGAVVLGVFGADAAMFGFDKLRQTMEQWEQIRKK